MIVEDGQVWQVPLSRRRAPAIDQVEQLDVTDVAANVGLHLGQGLLQALLERQGMQIVDQKQVAERGVGEKPGVNGRSGRAGMSDDFKHLAQAGAVQLHDGSEQFFDQCARVWIGQGVNPPDEILHLANAAFLARSRRLRGAAPGRAGNRDGRGMGMRPGILRCRLRRNGKLSRHR